MLNKKSDYIYNERHVVVVPTMSLEYLEGLEYSFKNTILFDNTSGIDLIIDFINKNNFKQIILVDYQIEYHDIIEKLKEKHDIKIIFTKSMGAFSNSFVYSLFKGVLELYEKYNISRIGFLDENLYKTLKNKNINCYHIKLDLETIENTSEFDSKKIGLLNNEENPRHSFYNELSALKFKNYIAVLHNVSKVTKKFMKLFDIKYEKSKSIDDVYKKNLVNLYINFTDNDNLTFIKSMDYNVPCILGNNELLKTNKYLNSMLVVKSDDSIDEISKKINLVKKHRKEILNEYKAFRKKYSKESNKTIIDFLGFNPKVFVKQEQKSKLLLSIVVPVYNTEKYLESSLKSIIRALPSGIKKQTEILLINDGSTDDSEKIIIKYKNKYPNLITYIKQKNHGLGNVRNVALKNAKGKYIASIDSDDTINKAFFKDALKYMQKDIDIIIYDWLSVTDNSKFETAAIEWCFNDINKYEGLLYTTIMPSTCNKIIKKSLYDNLRIKFIEDKYEDLSTNPFIMLSAKTIKYINKPYYEYYIRSNSIMRSSAGYSMIEILKEVDNRLDKYKNYINVDIEKFRFYTYSWRIEEFIFNQLYTLDQSNLFDFTKKMDEIKNIILDIIHNKYYVSMLNSIPDKKFTSFINDRNKAYENGKMLEFIKKVRNNKNNYLLNAPIIYYGLNK